MKRLLTLLLFLTIGISASAQCSDIFFSEYIEGSGNNKAIEIYNPTSSPIDLSDYMIHRNANGALTPNSSLQPIGTLASGGVFVITNSQAIGNIPLVSDTTSALATFNGDDAVWIEKLISGDTIDVIGEIGIDPGTNWPVDTGSTKNYTLIRKIAIQSGQKNWAIGATEWNIYAIDMDDSLGMHTGTPCPIIPCSPTTSTLSTTACSVYTSPSGTIYTTAGTYNDTISNMAGCDSIITISLLINSPTYGNETVTACGAYTWTNGITYTTSTQTATDTLVNTNGCDSIITLDLTINYPSSLTIFVNSCGPNLWIMGDPANNVYYYADTVLYDTLVAANGCDSILTVDITVNDPYTIEDSIITCGDAYTWMNGITYTSNNSSASAAYLTVDGCDSVITLDLTFIDIDNVVTHLGNSLTTAQSGANYQWLDCDNNFALIAGATNQTFTPSDVIGNYAVLITLGNCSDTSACQFIDLNSVENNNPLSATQVFPNPNFGLITINLGTLNEVNLKLIEISGKTVFEAQGISQKLYQLEHQLPTGIYFLEINAKGNSRTFKVIVQ